MNYRKLTVLIFAALLAKSSFAQQKGVSSPCMVEYENHNQMDYGPLVVQEIKGTITDPQQVAIPKLCVGIFTEKDHKLVATTESDADGKFSLQRVPPGRYRLVVKAEPLCAANVPLQVVKHQKKEHALLVHMKRRGLDSCSYGEAVQVNKSVKILLRRSSKDVRCSSHASVFDAQVYRQRTRFRIRDGTRGQTECFVFF